jgi:hypothetical protein
MHPDPYPDRPLPQPLRDQPSGINRIRRPRKRKKERITLRINLDPTKRRTRLTHDAPMIRKRPGIRIRAELIQQSRRPLHVREQKRHRPSRQIRAHQRIMRHRKGEVMNPAT